MIAWLPYLRYTITTALSVEEVMAVLAAHVAPRKGWNSLAGQWDARFAGAVTPRGFQINRPIAYRNSFLPFVYGRFHPTPTGTRIDLRITLSTNVFLLMGAFFAVAVAMCMSPSSVPPTAGSPPVPLMLIPLFLPAVLYLMTTVGFNLELRATLEGLAEVFPGLPTPVPASPRQPWLVAAAVVGMCAALAIFFRIPATLFDRMAVFTFMPVFMLTYAGAAMLSLAILTRKRRYPGGSPLAAILAEMPPWAQLAAVVAILVAVPLSFARMSTGTSPEVMIPAEGA